MCPNRFNAAVRRAIQRAACRNHKEQGLKSQTLFDLGLHKTAHIGLLTWLQQIHLVHHHDDLLAIIAQQFKIEPVGFPKSVFCRKDKYHQIAAVQEIAGSLLMLHKHRAGAGCIHQHHTLPTHVGMEPHAHPIRTNFRAAAGTLAIADQFDHLCRRRDPGRKQAILQERIDEGGLARVKLANHHNCIEHVAQVVCDLTQPLAIRFPFR